MSEIIDKINDIEDLSFTHGCSQERIKQAEKKLGLTFPQEFKDYVMEFGCIDFGVTEWSGLPPYGSVAIDVVEATIAARNDNVDFPSGHFVLDEDWMAIVDENGVVYTYDGISKSHLADSISEYLDICIKKMED